MWGRSCLPSHFVNFYCTFRWGKVYALSFFFFPPLFLLPAQNPLGFDGRFRSFGRSMFSLFSSSTRRTLCGYSLLHFSCDGLGKSPPILFVFSSSNASVPMRAPVFFRPPSSLFFLYFRRLSYWSGRNLIAPPGDPPWYFFKAPVDTAFFRSASLCF